MENFKENNPEGLNEFLKKLDELVEDFHHDIYLLDGVFKGIKKIKKTIFKELNKDNNSQK
jgi:archaellum component FlaC